MNKDKKTIKVTSIKYHPLNLTIPVNFDRDDKNFWSDVNGKRYSDKSWNILEKLVIDAVIGATNTEWVSYISVMISSKHGTVAELEITPNRGYMATFDGVIKGCQWDVEANKRLAKSGILFNRHNNAKNTTLPFTVWSSYSGNPNVYYLPYDDQTWKNVSRMAEVIKEMRFAFNWMLKNSEILMSDLVIGVIYPSNVPLEKEEEAPAN